MHLHLYGFFIAFGIAGAVMAAERMKSRLQPQSGGGWLKKVDLITAMIWMVIPALAGARIYHVVDYWGYYASNPTQILAIWQGGLGIFGAMAGGVAGLVFYSIRRGFSREQFWLVLDLAGAAMPLGQAVGRWGNFFNQELYGLPTGLPWGIYIRPENRLTGYENFSRFHPLFWYESIWCFIIFLILRAQIKRKKFLSFTKPGTIFFLYLWLYSFGRFWLEWLRIDPWQGGALTVAQWWCIGLMVFSLAGWLKRSAVANRAHT